MNQILSAVGVFVCGLVFGYTALNTISPNEPVRKIDMAVYEIQFQRCLDKRGATVDACHDQAKFRSLACINCR